METKSSRRLFRFGVFEADQKTEELRKQGRRLPLQGQPLQVLLMLLNRPGELVTRAEIHQALWPDGTFVDFDHGLNTAINKIRDALSDSAASPRFIETLARRGYRFIAPVEVTDGTSVPVVPPGPSLQRQAAADLPQPMPPERVAATTQSVSGFAQHLLTSPDEMPQASRPLVRSLFLLLQVMYLCFYAISLARLSIVQDIIRSMVSHTLWAVVLVVVTAAMGIPTRLYLISALAFNAPGLRENFLRMFPVIFPLDELWALAPFLLVKQLGYGLALGITAALLYVPFAQRSLILMGAGAPARAKQAAS
jgi:cholera toxin transcriptional activator